MVAFCETRHTAEEWFDYLSDRIAPEPNSGCWIWLGSLTPNGYAIGPARPGNLHRAIYQNIHGNLSGMTLDHLCRVRCCINPAHLEPVTNKENILRGVSFSAVNAKKTHCIRGHPFTPANTLHRPGGWRDCRICRYMFWDRASERRSARRKAAREQRREASHG